MDENTVSIGVRLAALADAGLVRDVMLAAYAEHKGALPVDSGAHLETVDDVVEGMRRGGAVVAYDGREVVGSARFTAEDDCLYVGRVAVLPSHRRRGVASAMMRFMDEVAQQYGRDMVRVGVRRSLPGNVALYVSLGYEVVGVDPHPRGPDEVVTMTKRIAVK